jgi:hypothetical protein
MYFGNNLGLLEYDGANWRLIHLPNKSVVRSLTKDANGRIYVGGVGHLGYLDSDDRGNLTYVSLLPFMSEEQQNFACVWEAFATPAGIYFSTSGRLFLWKPREEKFKTWEAATAFHVSALAGDEYYIRQWEIGLMKVAGDSLALVPGGEQFAEERIYTMLPFPGKPGTVLVGTRTQGLFLFDGRTTIPPAYSSANRSDIPPKACRRTGRGWR